MASMRKWLAIPAAKASAGAPGSRLAAAAPMSAWVVRVMALYGDSHASILLMNPFVVLGGSGPVASQESALIIEAVLLMLVIITPVLALLFYFAWRYRKGSGARWEPEWEHSRMDELVWWAVPVEVVLVLGALAWQGTHALDPHRALASSAPALTVEVVALPWKWLFIYPAYGVASVNFAEIPAGVPVNFEITADAPMNAFWVPALGG